MLVRVGDREYPAAEGALYGLLGNADQFLALLNPANCTVSSYVLDRLPRFEREQAAAELSQLRSTGATVLLASHNEEFLQRFADEIWWIEDGAIRERGAPLVVLEHYRFNLAKRLRSAAEGVKVPLRPSIRRGDGRASLEEVQILSEAGNPTAAWRSGEAATVLIAVQFAHPVDDPVIGILIRTRIGLDVYGTNTELENLHFGPVPAHHALRIAFRFRCDLCPGEYTLTAASHDPDGTWHDWLEDAVAFTVTDSRYTAGVVNLRARAEIVQNI